jgi:hypothetical protein
VTDEPSEPSGVYYKCLRGDSENLGITEPFSFVVHDARGRNWICYPVSHQDVERLSLRDHVIDVAQADAALRKSGISRRGTEMRVHFCGDNAELREKLAIDPPPRPTKLR